jgi:hypothetical protein
MANGRIDGWPLAAMGHKNLQRSTNRAVLEKHLIKTLSYKREGSVARETLAPQSNERLIHL